MAPLDNPVVPPVYCSNAIESSVLKSAASGRPQPSAMAFEKGVTVPPLSSGSLYAGAISVARCRTARVIQEPYRPPRRSPIDATTTCFNAVRSMTCSSVAPKFSRMTMAVAPESFSWCSSSRAVQSGLTLTQVARPEHAAHRHRNLWHVAKHDRHTCACRQTARLQPRPYGLRKHIQLPVSHPSFPAHRKRTRGNALERLVEQVPQVPILLEMNSCGTPAG